MLYQVIIVSLACIYATNAISQVESSKGIYELVSRDDRIRRDITIMPGERPGEELANHTSAIKKENEANTENDVINDDHKYYKSNFIKNGGGYFIDLVKGKDVVPGKNVEVFKHKLLSSTYLKADKVSLKFAFPFYGNFIKSVIITTGGFASLGPIFHSYVHIVHYVAPLMANFNPRYDNSSEIFIASGDDIFIAQWKDVIMNGSKNLNEKFNFEMILHKNGSIVLAYKNIPTSPALLANTTHNVTVGVADGFIITYTRKGKNKKIYHNYIYSYHKVNLLLDDIKTNLAIQLHLQPNCVQLKGCDACLNRTQSGRFICKWCDKLKLCSDMLDWNRQQWLENKCNMNAYSNQSQCAAKTRDTSKMVLVKKHRKKVGGKSGTMVGAIIGVLLIMSVLCGIGFFFYAYSHPQSKAGMWLIEHRPSRVFNKDFKKVPDEQLL